MASASAILASVAVCRSFCLTILSKLCLYVTVVGGGDGGFQDSRFFLLSSLRRMLVLLGLAVLDCSAAVPRLDTAGAGGVTLRFFRGMSASISISSSSLLDMLAESELVTAGTPSLMILLLELCELNGGALDRVEREEKDVLIFFGGCEEAGGALGGGGLVDFMGEGSSTACSRLVLVRVDSCEECKDAKPLDVTLLSTAPFTCFRGDFRVGVALPDLACDSRSGVGLAVASFRGRPGRLFGVGLFCCGSPFPLLG